MKSIYKDSLSGIDGLFKLKVYKKGELIETYEDKNLLVDVGKEFIAKRISGDHSYYVTSIGFGTSNSDPIPGDTGLTDQYVKALTDHTYPAVNKVSYNWELLTTEFNGYSIREFGLFTSDGILVSRKIRGDIYKDSDIYLSGEWVLTFNAV